MRKKNNLSVGRPLEFTQPKQVSFYVESPVIDEFDKKRGNISRGRYLKVLLDLNEGKEESLKEVYNFQIENLKEELNEMKKRFNKEENRVLGEILDEEAEWAKKYKPVGREAPKNWFEIADGRCLFIERHRGIKIKPYEYIEKINKRLKK